MRIAVIGHICRDIIHPPEGSSSTKSNSQQWGGIYYTLLTLSTLLKESDTIIPVFGVGKADYADLLERLSPYKNISTKGIYALPGPTNAVHLFYEQSSDSRIECSAHISPPIPFGLIKPPLDADGVIVNMISGFDISLETLDQIRIEVRNDGTPIHFDFHSLTLGVDKEAKRFRRPLTDWRRWCFMLNTIQLSEGEAKGLTAERYDEASLINQMMMLMVSNLLITRGHRGVTLIQQKQKKLTRHDFSGITLSPNPDPTGCGDVFGASFLVRLLQSKDAVLSAEYANRVAALNATLPGAEDISRIPELFAKHFPADRGEKGPP
jgi:sugar/nucleoside kinase (ribokinase family)